MALSGHALAEARSLRMHRTIAERIQQNPDLLATARFHLETFRAQKTLARPYIDAWQALLDGPVSELLAMLIDESEQARALRQATPFAGLLKPRERWALLKQRAEP
jgi:hypothetical protein